MLLLLLFPTFPCDTSPLSIFLSIHHYLFSNANKFSSFFEYKYINFINLNRMMVDHIASFPRAENSFSIKIRQKSDILWFKNNAYRMLDFFTLSSYGHLDGSMSRSRLLL